MSVASQFERQMLDLINQERAARGIDALTLELRLNDASEDHSTWMDDTLVFSHTGVDGSDPGDRMRDAGFEFSGNWTWGENIAYQSERGAQGITDDVADLHASLMNSPGHRANILNPDFDLIGIGIEVGDGRGFDAVYVTQKFASTEAPVQLDQQIEPPTDPFTGTSGDDVLAGDGDDNTLAGVAGDDRILARAGDDTVFGGTGRDDIQGGAGEDDLRGSAGGDDIAGGAGADRISGGKGNDGLGGGSGSDTITGGAGRDTIDGGGGSDVLRGGAGNDSIDGGAGDDRISGQAGRDRFVFSTGQDIVTDFDIGETGERIDLRSAGTISSFADLTGGGHLRTVSSGTRIDDLNGNTMLLKGVDVQDLAANDFVF
ncbi:MAG: CAP domain-containing protein [Pseudomonadota bacterium]